MKIKNKILTTGLAIGLAGLVSKGITKIKEIELESDIVHHLDLNNDGKKESIFIEADVDYVDLNINNYTCTMPDFKFIKDRQNYYILIGENIYGLNVGVPKEELSEMRYKDKYIWNGKKIVPTKKYYTIQIGYVSSHKNAIKFVNKFRKKGYDIYLRKNDIKGSTFYGILLGSYGDKENASQDLKNFKKKINPNTKAFIKVKDPFCRDDIW